MRREQPSGSLASLPCLSIAVCISDAAHVPGCRRAVYTVRVFYRRTRGHHSALFSCRRPASLNMSLSAVNCRQTEPGPGPSRSAAIPGGGVRQWTQLVPVVWRLCQRALFHVICTSTQRYRQLIYCGPAYRIDLQKDFLGLLIRPGAI